MPEPADDLSDLPLVSSLRGLRSITIDLARRLDPLIGHLEDEKASAEITIRVRRGEPMQLDVLRSFKLN